MADRIRRSKQKKTKTMELPYELVTEILVRVPVKDLVRFRCVCKRWRFLFGTKDFIKKQMTYAPRKVLAMQDNGGSPPRSFLYEQGENGIPKVTLEEADPTCGDKGLVDLDVMGHCDGLFCLRLQDRSLAVWNPLLRQVRKVSSKSTKPITSHDLIGFGYDHSIDDYKIVIFSALSETILAPKDWSRGEIFTLKPYARWTIDQFPEIRRCLDVRRTLAGNKIFWQVNNDPDNAVESETILSFDLSSEEFDYKSFPRNMKGLIRGLVAVRGCLGFVELCMFQFTPKIVVWTASKDKFWSKLCTLDYNFHDRVGFQRNGVALVKTYEDKEQWSVQYLGHEAVRFCTYYFTYYFDRYIKVETLLSLN